MIDIFCRYLLETDDVHLEVCLLRQLILVDQSLREAVRDGRRNFLETNFALKFNTN